MDKDQAEQLIAELHELNKTLKTITGSHERNIESVLTKNVYIGKTN